MDALTERARPRWGRLLKRIVVIALGAAVAGIILVLLFSADARYIARAGIEEARLMMRRRSIEKGTKTRHCHVTIAGWTSARGRSPRSRSSSMMWLWRSRTLPI